MQCFKPAGSTGTLSAASAARGLRSLFNFRKPSSRASRSSPRALRNSPGKKRSPGPKARRQGGRGNKERAAGDAPADWTLAAVPPQGWICTCLLKQGNPFFAIPDSVGNVVQTHVWCRVTRVTSPREGLDKRGGLEPIHCKDSPILQQNILDTVFNQVLSRHTSTTDS